MYTLSVDFGTSSVKASIVDNELNVLKSAKREYYYIILDNEGVELDAEAVFKAFLDAISDLKEYLPKVEAFCYDTFSPSLVLMNSEGDPISKIITHLDRRSRAQTKYICDSFGASEFRKITGILPFSGGVTITSILWLIENAPEIFNKAYKIGHLNTYIYKKLTGIWTSDPVNASMMGIYNTVLQNGWSDEICNTFNIPMNLLPPINNAGVVLGYLTKEISSLTGLKEGIPVAVGSNDAATAQIAANNENEGDILNISGSSEMISIISEKPIVNPSYYLRCAVTPGKWQFYAITIGGFAIEWFKNNFCLELTKQQFFDQFLPNTIKRGTSNGIIFEPHLAGDRQSLDKKYGSFNNLTLKSTKEDMLYALLVGTHQPVINTINISRQFISLNPIIKLTGGLIDENYISLKKRILPDFEYKAFKNGPIIGNVKLLNKGLKR